MPRPAAPPNADPPVEGEVLAVAGQGDAVVEAGGRRVFAPFGLPGERVRLTLEGERGEIVEVLRPSLHRAAPPCKHFGACGGCALQHWDAAPYLDWKRGQVALRLSQVGLSPEVLPPFAAPPGSRRRLALHARPGGRDGARLGFKGRRSWSLVEIEACPVADPRLAAALPALRRLAAPFLEHPKSAPTLHVTLTQTGLDVDVTGVERRSGGLSADARMRAAEAASAADFARVTLAGEIVYQARQPLVRIGRALAALPPGGFLQAVPEAEAAMAAFAVEAVAAAGASKVADLFCGLGTFALRLAETASVRAVDSDARAVAALASAVGATPGLKGVAAEARDLFRRPVPSAELNRVEAVVFDPPRAGAAEQTREIAASSVPLVVGVSCNPATFARDARTLADAGFRLETVLPVDQFLWSPHIELVGVFRR